MRSIRKVLLVGTFGAMVALLVASGAFLFFMVRTTLLRQFDDALMDKAAVLMASVEVKSGHVIFDDEDLDMDELESADGLGYLQIQTDDEETIYRSPSLANNNLQYGPDENEGPVIGWVELHGGRSGRAVYAWFEPRVDDEDAAEIIAGGVEFVGKRVELVFARDSTPVMATLRRLELILLAFGVGTIALASVLLHSVIHRALKPLDALAGEIEAVKPEDLTTAIDVSGCPEELRPVVDRLNELLARLKSALDRERAFSADVAHELRTPLSGICATLEVALSRQRSTPEYETALKQCLDVAGDMQAMVENLLTLARLDSGEFEVVREEIELDSIIDAALAPLRSSFTARNIDIQLNAESNIAVNSDSSLLQFVARNLFDNALSYTNDGGWVKVTARNNGESAILRVSNSGSQIAAERSNDVFERFWRADASRTDTGTHCGLGLSLVKKIVTTLGGTVEVVSSDGDIFEIAVAIPKIRPMLGGQPGQSRLQ